MAQCKINMRRERRKLLDEQRCGSTDPQRMQRREARLHSAAETLRMWSGLVRDWTQASEVALERIVEIKKAHMARFRAIGEQEEDRANLVDSVGDLTAELGKHLQERSGQWAQHVTAMMATGNLVEL